MPVYLVNFRKLVINRDNMNSKSKTGLRLPVNSSFLASTETEANWGVETA
jgi:hypothetical protein